MIMLWAGCEDSYGVVLQAEQKVAEGQKQGRFLSGPTEADLPQIWQKAGDTGVIKVAGSLVNGSSGWYRMFGVLGYDDILNAVKAAVSDPDVKSLLVDVSSGGGQVHGLADFATALNKLTQQKPSMTFTGSLMASAAYWTGSSVAGPIMISPTAEVGSLGVLLVTSERTKQLANEGISVTVHRAGHMKARINPYEELTAEVKAEIQGQLDDLHAMFKSTVKNNRPGMTAEDLKNATDGRTFLGKKAQSLGLVDSIGSVDVALKLLDKHSRRKDTSPNSKGAAMFLTPEQLAKVQSMMASGMSMADAMASLGIVVTAEMKAEIDQITANAKAEADKAAAEAATKAATEAAAAAAAATPAATTVDASAVDLLKSQLATSQAEARAASTELAVLKATTQSNQAAHDGLLAIARGALANMLIPMGGSAASAEAMDATTVIAEHARVKEKFQAQFRPGQQSVSGSETVKPAEPAQQASLAVFAMRAKTSMQKSN